MIALRPGAETDGAGVAAIYAPIVTHTAISFEEEVPDAAEMARRIAAAAPRSPWLVCTEGERVLGYAYGGTHRARAAYRWTVEVSVYVAEDARGRGVGHGLYAALLEVLTRQGFHRAVAGITLPNAASVSLHERLGFAGLGVYHAVGWKHGAWHDVGWWERELAGAAASTAEPILFADLADHPDVHHALARGAARIR